MRPSFIARIYNIYTPMLGRWALSYNYKIQNFTSETGAIHRNGFAMNFKIDNANMDHCGCCIINSKNEISDDELWPYCI
jgi:hypothetical protein